MDPISLILAALVAGAAGGVLDAMKDDVKERAKARYELLHGLAKKRLAGREAGEIALERYPTAPQKWEAVLADELTVAGAASDDELIIAAKELLQLIDQAGAASGRYNVTITGGQGVQIGSYNVQANYFTAPPPARAPRRE
jgi:hypothetical protein